MNFAVPAQARLVQPVELAKDLFRHLEAEGIAHCHWKSNIRLAEALSGTTDIDLLVEAARQKDCERLLLDLEFRRFNAPGWAQYAGIEDWLGFDDQTGSLIHVQLHFRLVTGRKFIKEQDLPWQRHFFENLIKDPEFGVFIPSPAVELVLLYARVVSKTGLVPLLVLGPELAIPRHIRDELAYLRSRCESGKLREHFLELLPGEDPRVVEWVAGGAALADRRRAVSTWVYIRHRLREWRTSAPLPSWWLSWLRKLRVRCGMLVRELGGAARTSKTPPAGGRLIAFVGPDGSGKSTVSERLCKWLQWKVETRSIYLGNDRGVPVSLVRRVYRFWRDRLRPVSPTSKTAENDPSSRDEQRKPTSPPDSLRALLALRNAAVRRRRLRQARMLRDRGYVILTDRYPQSQLTGMLDGPSQPFPLASRGFTGWLSKLEHRYYNEMAGFCPDVVIKLGVSPQVALQRKPDHSPSEIRRKSEALSELQFPGAKIYEVDASQSLDSVIHACKRIVWETL